MPGTSASLPAAFEHGLAEAPMPVGRQFFQRHGFPRDGAPVVSKPGSATALRGAVPK